MMHMAETGRHTLSGQVVQLDRKYPLVMLASGERVRCKHSTDLMKNADVRAVVGDFVAIDYPQGQDMPLIALVEPRSTQLIRKDPAERSLPQVLAANFDLVLVVHPLNQLNIARLQRELVLAYETGARVGVVLTKSDLAESPEDIVQAQDAVRRQVGDACPVITISNEEEAHGLEAVRAMIPAGVTAVLIGRSGVGKSSMVNLLAGSEVQRTGEVREFDGKGRHTTVSRCIVDIPGGGRVVDMPGVRGLGMWEADQGIGAAFYDVETWAQECKFNDCTHTGEPGCAVARAVRDGELSPERLAAYVKLKDETATIRRRKEQAAWKHGKIGNVRTFKQKHNRSQ